MTLKNPFWRGGLSQVARVGTAWSVNTRRARVRPQVQRETAAVLAPARSQRVGGKPPCKRRKTAAGCRSCAKAQSASVGNPGRTSYSEPTAAMLPVRLA